MDIRNNFNSIQQIQGQYLNNKKDVSKSTGQSEVSFEEILKQKSVSSNESVAGLKFSKHADERLSDRNINLSPEQMERLNDGTRKASEKGINESLMIMDNLAFIVNIKNNTVITAIDSSSSEDNVFTNIDGAVIV